MGQVLISNLVNRATVLLNYPIGDVASLAPGPCPCGRTFARLSELEGRVEDVLRLRGGRLVHPRTVWQALKPFPEILQYQLVQEAAGSFDLRLVTGDEEAFLRIRDAATAALGALLGEGPVRAVRRETLLPQAGGKFRAVVSAGNAGAAASS